MHPDRTFRVDDSAALFAGLRARPFCTLAAVMDGLPVVAHAPVVVVADAHLQFHLSRRNPLAELSDGAEMVVTQLGPDAYISPDWYADRAQVPTWNYQLIQVEGRIVRLSDAELIGHVETLSAEQEARLAPKPPWLMTKVPEKKLDGLLRGIVGFSLMVERIEGVDKFSQNKNAVDRAGVAEALKDHPLGALIPKG